MMFMVLLQRKVIERLKQSTDPMAKKWFRLWVDRKYVRNLSCVYLIV